MSSGVCRWMDNLVFGAQTGALGAGNLLDYACSGGDWNAPDSQGRLLLHAAWSGGNFELADLLLKLGANPCEFDGRGRGFLSAWTAQSGPRMAKAVMEWAQKDEQRAYEAALCCWAQARENPLALAERPSFGELLELLASFGKAGRLAAEPMARGYARLLEAELAGDCAGARRAAGQRDLLRMQMFGAGEGSGKAGAKFL